VTLRELFVCRTCAELVPVARRAHKTRKRDSMDYTGVLTKGKSLFETEPDCGLYFTGDSLNFKLSLKLPERENRNADYEGAELPGGTS